MYFYDFSKDHGRSWEISVNKIEEIMRERQHRDCSLIVVRFTGSDHYTYYKHRDLMGVTYAEEGRIWKRTFWLKELDMEKAQKIVNEYREQRRLEAEKRLKSL